jgi:hypothetical protein
MNTPRLRFDELDAHFNICDYHHSLELFAGEGLFSRYRSFKKQQATALDLLKGRTLSLQFFDSNHHCDWPIVTSQDLDTFKHQPLYFQLDLVDTDQQLFLNYLYQQFCQNPLQQNTWVIVIPYLLRYFLSAPLLKSPLDVWDYYKQHFQQQKTNFLNFGFSSVREDAFKYPHQLSESNNSYDLIYCSLPKRQGLKGLSFETLFLEGFLEGASHPRWLNKIPNSHQQIGLYISPDTDVSSYLDQIVQLYSDHYTADVLVSWDSREYPELLGDDLSGPFKAIKWPKS